MRVISERHCSRSSWSMRARSCVIDDGSMTLHGEKRLVELYLRVRQEYRIADDFMGPDARRRRQFATESSIVIYQSRQMTDLVRERVIRLMEPAGWTFRRD